LNAILYYVKCHLVPSTVAEEWHTAKDMREARAAGRRKVARPTVFQSRQRTVAWVTPTASVSRPPNKAEESIEKLVQATGWRTRSQISVMSRILKRKLERDVEGRKAATRL
jgi:hypothetical protein